VGPLTAVHHVLMGLTDDFVHLGARARILEIPLRAEIWALVIHGIVR
jgi:hypothetical protein